VAAGRRGRRWRYGTGSLPSEWVSGKVDLDELFRNAKPVGDVGDWAIPGFFADEEEFGEFQAWLKDERAAGLA
jgi:hypothetical protein